jgi:hypothetical protein
MKVNMQFDQTPGATQRQQAGAAHVAIVKLRQIGRSYAGYQTGLFAVCNGKADKDRWTFNIRVTKAKYVGDTWTAIKWEGTWTRSATFNTSLCSLSRLSAVIRGSLAK